jgi:hypothetical protein
LSSGILLVLLAAAGAQIPPVDQCASDPAFAAFRAELTQAIERRDADAILAKLADEVMVDFGGGHGKSAFAKAWNLDHPDQSGLWDELKTILRLGCTSERGGWSMPSLGSQLDAEADPLETYLAIVPGSPLRSEPRDDSFVVAQLNWDLLTLHDVTDDQKWLRVSLRDGRAGYVRSEETRNPLDYRMGVQRVHDALRITHFVAGD